VVVSFDNISHCLIMDLVTRQIADGNILSVIRKFVRRFPAPHPLPWGLA
jgi:hypothetical protein